MWMMDKPVPTSTSWAGGLSFIGRGGSHGYVGKLVIVYRVIYCIATPHVYL